MLGRIRWSAGCSPSFVTDLEGGGTTTAAKQTLAGACRGQRARVRGILLDIVPRGADAFDLQLRSDQGNTPMVVVMRETPGTYLSALKRGSTVTIDARLREFSGTPPIIVLEEGVCADCGR